MRVIVISDMEGVSGIVNAEQVLAGRPLYEEGRRLYTEDINAAVRGARAAGATEVIVMDHHGAGGAYNFNSLIPDVLDSGCEYVVQASWTEYTAALEEGCDACLLIGMHAMAGTQDGVLAHTVSGTSWTDLRFNGTLVGETGINAALCGTWDCPVVMVSGDSATCAEATALLGDRLTTVAVKQGLGRQKARLVAPTRARELIEEGARRALSNFGAVAPYDPGSPCEIEVAFSSTEALDAYRRKPGIEVLHSRKLVSRGETWWEAWQRLYH
ncbi:MAG TPA: M55 family metallopeptidase [Actinomycetota bacterium]|nr:M55 family metallopeptidase [Actinomycetota bacterium]